MEIYEKGFEKPSLEKIALWCRKTGSDILARAKNGTGKTAAFIPALEKIDQDQKSYSRFVRHPNLIL
jgi:ATP-dependent RNA helicase DDX6/DHH1